MGKSINLYGRKTLFLCCEAQIRLFGLAVMDTLHYFFQFSFIYKYTIPEFKNLK